MTTLQLIGLFGLLASACIGAWRAAALAAAVHERLVALERKNERRDDMLIAILDRLGVDPVTLK